RRRALGVAHADQAPAAAGQRRLTVQRARWGLIVLAVALAGCHDAPHERFVAPWKRFLVGIDMAGGLDTSRMNLRDGEAHVWLRFQYSQPQSIGNPPTHYSVVEVRESVRCPTHEARNERMLIRDAQ